MRHELLKQRLHFLLLLFKHSGTVGNTTNNNTGKTLLLHFFPQALNSSQAK